VLSIYSIDDALGSRQIPDLPEEDDPLVMSNVKEVEISRYVNKLLLQFSIDDGDE
jgi:hypothetical protein